MLKPQNSQNPRLKMKHKLLYTAATAAMAAMVVLFLLGVASFDSADTVGMSVTRACGSVAFTALIVADGKRLFKPRPNFWHAIMFSLPAFVIAVNNFPIIPIITCDAHLDAEAGAILMLLIECLLIGLFEETAFRGIILVTILERFSETKKQVFASLVISSAAFGLVHILNLFAGAGLAPTLQQVGYSFLIGGMCAVVMVKTRCLPLCVAIHAIYDFCGFAVPRLGDGTIWTAPEIILTVVVSVAVFVYFVREALRLTPEDAEI